MKACGGAIARLALGCALAVAFPAETAIAASITIDARRDGEAIDIHASTVLNADAATAWRVLTDYRRYVDFIPDLRMSRVTSRRGATVTVEQSGDATIWMFKMPLDITFEIEENPPNNLQSRAVAGTLRALASSYVLAPDAHGTRLDYVGRITPGFALLGHIEHTLVTRNIAQQFQALADEIEKQALSARSSGRPRP